MNKGKNTMIITIGIACFILVLIIFMQFKVVYQTDITSIDTMREEDLKSELANWKSKYESSEQKYTETTETLKKYKDESTSNSKTKTNLQEELENTELMLGKTNVEGPGLIIKLSDPKENQKTELDEMDTEERVSSSELLKIVNYLKDAGAEAISINGQRVVNQTDIVQITDIYIKMNSVRISPPYEIKAIGDAEYLKSSLIGVGYYDKIKGWGQEIEFEESKKITINKYNGNMETKYIEK